MKKIKYCITMENGTYDYTGFEEETEEDKKPDPEKLLKLIDMYLSLTEHQKELFHIYGIGVFVEDENSCTGHCLCEIEGKELDKYKK